MAAKDEMIQVNSQALALNGKDLEAFIVKGDMRALSPEAKAAHYVWVCNRLGLEPATKPFDYIVLNGREIMYANKGCADQLRKLHEVSISIATREEVDGVYYVYVRASLPSGRADEDCGAVSVSGLKGDMLANAKMKATTKAKRRVTLSILGLGMLDESELETIERSRFDNLPSEVAQKQPASNVVQIEPAREPSKKGEILPEVPKQVTTIPASILLAIKPLDGLVGIAIQDMDDDDLELVKYHALKIKEVWRITTKSKRALDWLDAIAGTAAEELVKRKMGDMPPREEPPMPVEP